MSALCEPLLRCCSHLRACAVWCGATLVKRWLQWPRQCKIKQRNFRGQFFSYFRWTNREQRSAKCALHMIMVVVLMTFDCIETTRRPVCTIYIVTNLLSLYSTYPLTVLTVACFICTRTRFPREAGRFGEPLYRTVPSTWNGQLARRQTSQASIHITSRTSSVNTTTYWDHSKLQGSLIKWRKHFLV